ncbi:sucrase ferredoxin [Frankia sp. AgB1.9]|uniref:sucrase ferredoxin n=1 Tax=unclassified Frankia TaxID=2632575 RepID=UPI001931D26C|nr:MULTISPECIES: sucrase ferredoxin [unclassified Frankia]MBL7488227.1 sucrase ferredoxin [Frankia sp. AgW1.1]MBL7548130.1 sucrase ferredoxin [Frankia sp. AgB1.9]MBL7620356.1 sucrase ferredoxin [Frankia sp. AgB1.8]
MTVVVSSPAISYRCAPWTLAQGVDPIGSALTCDTFVLIETPPPWPQDIGQLPTFAELSKRGLRRTRLLAVRPVDDGLATGSSVSGAVADSAAETSPEASSPGTADVAGIGDRVAVTIWRRAETGRFLGTDHLIPAERVVDEAARLATAPIENGRPAGEGRLAPPDVLLCGHGSRDVCCGRLGTRLALAVADTWPDVRVRRCSHTGGHRYAPTGFTLPDGLAWGFLDTDTLDAVVRRSGPPPLRGNYRGTTALDQWGQVAERELFERHGWAWLEHRLTSASSDVAADRRSATVHLAWDGPTGPGTATATVAVARDVPVLICGEPPENSRKTSPELGLTSLRITAG